MKNVILLIFLFVNLFTFNLHSQYLCGTVGSGDSPEGPFVTDCVIGDGNYLESSEYESATDLKLRVLLHIARNEDGSGGLDETTLTALISEIENSFTPNTEESIDLGFDLEICTREIFNIPETDDSPGNNYLTEPYNTNNYIPLGVLYPNYLNLFMSLRSHA